jgi:hypothetical protein
LELGDGENKGKPEHDAEYPPERNGEEQRDISRETEVRMSQLLAMKNLSRHFLVSVQDE